MAVPEKTVKDAQTASETINDLVAKGQKALKEFESFNQEQINKIVHAMVLAGLSEHMRLAKMAVEETGRGVYEDKIIKIFLQQNTFGIPSKIIKQSAS